MSLYKREKKALKSNIEPIKKYHGVQQKKSMMVVIGTINLLVRI